MGRMSELYLDIQMRDERVREGANELVEVLIDLRDELAGEIDGSPESHSRDLWLTRRIERIDAALFRVGIKPKAIAARRFFQSRELGLHTGGSL